MTFLPRGRGYLISRPNLLGNGAGSFTKNREIKGWGCANRITNGRAVCDSRHVSEDVLKETYCAAINDAVGNMDAIIETVKDSCQMVLVSDNHEALQRSSGRS